MPLSSSKAELAQDVMTEALVLRDFDVSRIAALRARVADQPAQMTVLFFAAVAVWTMLMSAGAALHGSNAMAVNLTPHVAHFTIILGFLFYPLRMIWIPTLGYLAVFLYPFFQPFTQSIRWIDLPGMTPGVGLTLLMINLAAGLTIGALFRVAFAFSQNRLRPHALDLFLAFASTVLFAIVCALQVLSMVRYAQSLPLETRLAFGFGPDFVELALNRIARGSAVLAAFLLAAIEFPRQGQFRQTLVLATSFPLLALAQYAGFGLYPMIDAVLLALVITMLAPVGVGLFACLGGVAIYAALTGQFLNDRLPDDPALWSLEKYSIVGLLIVVLVIAVRSRANHQSAQQNAAIRKLTRARCRWRGPVFHQPQHAAVSAGRRQPSDAGPAHGGPAVRPCRLCRPRRPRRTRCPAQHRAGASARHSPVAPRGRPARGARPAPAYLGGSHPRRA